MARNQNPEAAPWCPCLCGHVNPLLIMSQSSVVGFGNALLLREMRLQGLNVSLCIFLQHHFRKKQCWQRLHKPFVLLQWAHTFRSMSLWGFKAWKNSSESMTLLKDTNVLLCSVCYIYCTCICKFVYSNQRYVVISIWGYTFTCKLLHLFHIL